MVITVSSAILKRWINATKRTTQSTPNNKNPTQTDLPTASMVTKRNPLESTDLLPSPSILPPAKSSRNRMPGYSTTIISRIPNQTPHSTISPSPLPQSSTKPASP